MFSRRALPLVLVTALITVTTIATLFVNFGPPEKSKKPEHKEPLPLEATDTKSLQAILKNAPAGSTIKLASGNYRALSIEKQTWETPITLATETGDNAVFDALALTSVSGIVISNIDVIGEIKIKSSSKVTVRNGHLKSGVYIRDNSNNIDIRDNHIDGGRFGIQIYTVPGTTRNSHITIAGNDIEQQSSDNIQIGSCDYLTVEDNVIHDIPDNVDHNDGIQMMGGDNAVIRRNKFWNQDQAILLKAEPILGSDTTVNNARVENNLMIRSRGAGVIVAGTGSASIVNNTGADNHFADIHIERVNSNLRIWNNVVHQIFRTEGTSPGSEYNNCVERTQYPGHGDVIAVARFSNKTDYKLAANDSCARAATKDGAPLDDLGKGERGPTTTTGAWQK